MKPSMKELYYALLACILITISYEFVIYGSKAIPGAGSFFGHSVGIIGFILMLMTETLYSLRKRSRSARWGRMAEWMQFHIFTGIVGPFMVLLHSSWRFNGLAGVTLSLTAIIVISGFIGRYFYTMIPRTVDGLIDESLISKMKVGSIANARRLLALWHMIHIPIGMALFTSAVFHIIGALYFSTFLK